MKKKAAVSGGFFMVSASAEKKSVALTGLWREILLILPFLAFMLIGICRCFAALGDVWPRSGEIVVQLKPLLKTAFRIGENCLGGAFRLTDTAIDAFTGIDDQHVLALIETVHGADFDTVHVLALDAGLGHHISHYALSVICTTLA
jgi:hypothetical protein